MLRRFFLLCMISFIAIIEPSSVVFSADPLDGGRIESSHCKGDGSEVGQLFQKADALYASFKPREALKELFEATVKAEIPQMEYAFVDGYSSPGKLIEVEVTAVTSS
ncbi:MAG: hypothetical protein IH857_01655 [Deltaproteobacteria bacterium]|nr:hypothetical protein [Deltaproteobacteria bacterium]